MGSVRVAEKAGACFGVERALRLVEETLAEAPGPVATLGPLIHNPQVVDGLKARGVRVAREVPDDPGVTLVIRSHGVAPQIQNRARDLGLSVVDATCPYVKKAQRAAEEHAAAKRQVIVVGEAGHPEVEAILAHAPGAMAVSSPEEVEALELDGTVGLLAQTTQSPERLDAVARALREKGLDVVVANTICTSTKERQEAARALARDVDAMIIIGGRNSANTNRLAELCAPLCPTYHVESAEELDGIELASGMSLGVSAGASTPKQQIEAVCERLEELLDRQEGRHRG